MESRRSRRTRQVSETEPAPTSPRSRFPAVSGADLRRPLGHDAVGGRAGSPAGAGARPRRALAGTRHAASMIMAQSARCWINLVRTTPDHGRTRRVSHRTSKGFGAGDLATATKGGSLCRGDAILRSQVQRYILSMSTDDSTPSLTKFFASQSPAHFRPWSRRKMRKSQSALYLLVGLSAPMNSSSSMED